MKKLKRSRDKVFAGVLGGIGEYFDVDPTMLRVLFIFFVLVTGVFPGIIAYLFAILIMPASDAPIIHEINEEENGEDKADRN